MKIIQLIKYYLSYLAKSPAFTHLSATLSGLPTIRSFNTQAILQKEFDNLQDMHSACSFMIISSKCAFSLSLDTFCSIFVACVVFYYILMETEVSGEKIGLAISQALKIMTPLPWG